MLPKIISAVGAALTPEEIQAAIRVVSTRENQRAGIFRILDELTGVLVEFHVHKNTAYTTPGGVADFVGVALPNPTPYRGVSLGVLDFGEPHIEFDYSNVNAGGSAGGIAIYTVRNSAGVVVATSTGSVGNLASGGRYDNWLGDVAGSPFALEPQFAGYNTVPGRWRTNNGTLAGDGVILPFIPSYESILAADIAAGTGGRGTYVVASDGVTLAFESQNTVGSVVSFEPGSTTWSGGGFVDMFRRNGSVETYDHKLTFEVPEDCIYPIIDAPPAYPGAAITTVTFVGNIVVNGLGQSVGDDRTVTFSGPGGAFSISGTRRSQPPLTGELFTTITYNNYFVPTGDIYFDSFFAAGPLILNGVILLSPVAANDFSGATITSAFATPEYIAAASANPDTPRWIADWNAGVAAAKLRRKLWFKKNSDAALAQLKAGIFLLPASWDYQIKRRCPVSSNTRRPIIISITFVDATTSPLGTLGPEVGSTAFETRTRTTTLTYTIPVTQPDGSSSSEVRTEIIIGTLRRTQTRVATSTLSEIQSYVAWYTASTNLTSGVTAPITPRIPHQFLRDKSDLGLGLFWSGVVTSGAVRYADSTFALPSLGVGSPQPFYTNTLVGTAPPFLLTYHKDVPPEYTAPVPPAISTGSTTFNDSAMFDVTRVTLIPFALVKNGESLGMFADPSDNSGATQFEYYGKAVYTFDWDTGLLTFKSWSGLTDADGAPVAPLKADLPAGATLPTYNCVVKYESFVWEDVQNRAKQDKKDRAAGQGDRILAEILSFIR